MAATRPLLLQGVHRAIMAAGQRRRCPSDRGGGRAQAHQRDELAPPPPAHRVERRRRGLVVGLGDVADGVEAAGLVGEHRPGRRPHRAAVAVGVDPPEGGHRPVAGQVEDEVAVVLDLDPPHVRQVVLQRRSEP